MALTNYTADTLQICKAYNMEPNQVILSFALAAGAPPADAYRVTHNIKAGTTAEECETLCNALITSRPGIKIIINRIKNKQNPATYHKQEQRTLTARDQIKEIEESMSEEERDEFKTRSGLIEKIITQSTLTSGKDAISALQTLAKLQGFDKPDEDQQEEKRSYFLPWVSHCRSCALMKLYQKTINEKQPKEG